MSSADFVYGGMPVDLDAIVAEQRSGASMNRVEEAYVKIRFSGTHRFDTAERQLRRALSVHTETESSGFGSTNGGALAPVDIYNDYTGVAAEHQLHVQSRRGQALLRRRPRTRDRAPAAR